MDVAITHEGFVAEVGTVAEIDAPVLAEDADALDGFVAGVRDQMRKIVSDRNLSDEGRREARQSLGKAALGDLDKVGKAQVISRMERDLEGISKVLNPLRLALGDKAANAETQATMRELRNEIRSRLQAVEDDTKRELEAEILVGRLLDDGEDLALASLFDAYATSPMLSPVSKEVLDQAAERLFEVKHPAAAQRRGELEAVLTQSKFNRNRARKLIWDITGYSPDPEPVLF